MMYTKSHQGVVSKTVTIEFENGYSLTLEAGTEIGLFVAIAQQDVVDEDCLDEYYADATWHPGHPSHYGSK